LKTGILDLLTVAGSIYHIEHSFKVCNLCFLDFWFKAIYLLLCQICYIVLVILSLSILFFTKIKRWYHNHESICPKIVSKNRSDKEGSWFLYFLACWKWPKNQFDLYKEKEKPKLLNFVKILIKVLQNILDKVIKKIGERFNWSLKRQYSNPSLCWPESSYCRTTAINPWQSLVL
jgi:hypothetical protein